MCRKVRVTLSVLNAFARDIQRRVRGRIFRSARKQEMCAATRIQAWYQGWLVRSRDGYGAVLTRMRNHRLERARRIKVYMHTCAAVNTSSIHQLCIYCGVSSLLCGVPRDWPVVGTAGLRYHIVALWLSSVCCTYIFSVPTVPSLVTEYGVSHFDLEACRKEARG